MLAGGVSATSAMHGIAPHCDADSISLIFYGQVMICHHLLELHLLELHIFLAMVTSKVTMLCKLSTVHTSELDG